MEDQNVTQTEAVEVTAEVSETASEKKVKWVSRTLAGVAAAVLVATGFMLRAAFSGK